MKQSLAAVQPALSSTWKKLSRGTVLALLCFLPEERKHALQRWLRGREQFRTLRKADCVVVSFGKSGRTWLRVLLSRVYQLKHGLPEHYLMSFRNLNLANRAIPKIFFTHDNYLKDYSRHADTKVDYRDKKVLLLVRHPADVAVSQYHQWRYRMRPHKKALNRYPDHDEDVEIYDFVVHRGAGLAKVIDFMNGWAEAAPGMSDLLVVRYEDLRAETERTLGRILSFFGTPGSEQEIRDAVTFASFENMKKLEAGKTFRFSGGRFAPRDRDDPNTFKVRRGKVSGYRDYFTAEQSAEIDALIDSRLSPVFGYRQPETTNRARTA
jgi:Sulfotransferase domain